MHELSIAQELIRIVIDEQKRHQFKSVEIIKIKAGGLSGIAPHALEFAFGVLSEGTCAEKAQLDIESEKIKSSCRKCGHSADNPNIFSTCPLCHSLDVALQASPSFEIVALEVE